MKSKNICINIVLVFFIFFISACRTTVIFSTSEKDAKIYVDGNLMGTGKTDVVKLRPLECAKIKTEKIGFFDETLSYCCRNNNLRNIFTPYTKYIELTRDDAYDASFKDDNANKDFEQEVNKKFSESDAWKIISQIVTSYFDNIEMADKETGYLKTSWQSKSFIHKTVRTRIFVKQSSLSPLKYKIKILSEYSDNPDQSVKDDDRFKEWDRLLRKYEGVINEFQSRLGSK